MDEVRRRFHRFLDWLQPRVPASIRERVRNAYLQCFYYRMYPENAVHRAPDPEDRPPAESQSIESPSRLSTYQALVKQIDQQSDTAFEGVSDEQVAEVLSWLLVPLARNGFCSPARKSALFRKAERAGIHLLPVHYYSPVPDTSRLDERDWEHRFDRNGGWNLNAEGQVALLSQLAPFAGELEEIRRSPSSACPFSWDNGTFCETDAAVYYSLIRHLRPRQVLEVGAGNSTLIAAEACVKNGHTELQAIDPYPLEILRQKVPGLNRLIEGPVQQVPVARFGELCENDILFIDGSHVCRFGSDLNYLVFRVLPALQPGVIIHFHDIFLPWEFPRDWIVDRQLFWNEQYLLLAFLLFNDSFEVLLGTQYLGREMPGELLRVFPFLRVPGGASFWIRRKGT